MQNRRLEIHSLLCNILGCEEIGPECRCYFQPGSNVRMEYPAIRYVLKDIDIIYADNISYHSFCVYELILIDKNPESEYASEILKLSNVEFVRFYIANNLNHWVFTIY